jgi:hypothetical protein
MKGEDKGDRRVRVIRIESGDREIIRVKRVESRVGGLSKC